ncbi:MAG: carbamoyltransferase C-terminal domain-containing protein, partial [Pseudomonadota bacterium]
VAPRGWSSFVRSFPKWLTQNLWLEKTLADELGTGHRVVFCDHHLSHAASAFYPSPYDDAAILTIDGVGELATASWGEGHGHTIHMHQELRFPNSLGLLYSAFTHFTGFKINSGEYKLMGLAPYGRPIYTDTIRRDLVRVHDDGSLELNQRYFGYVYGIEMTNRRFSDLFGGPARRPESPLTQREMDLAASLQSVVNDVVIAMARHVRARTGLPRLVMAGGVALNVVATGQLLRERVFEDVWVQPAAGDAGGALGCALWAWHGLHGHPRQVVPGDAMRGSLLGPVICDESGEDDAMLEQLGGVWTREDASEVAQTIAGWVAQGLVVGLARGPMEWGPRALGARSILGDARSPRMQSHMNLKIKFREGFRPFAPIVKEESAADYFELSQPSPYMLFAYLVVASRRVPLSPEEEALQGLDKLKARRSEIPAVTHVDGSARVQTVDRVRNPFLHEVLDAFEKVTGCPVMINTSFNVRGEPIVANAEQAYRCFMATDIDRLVIGNRMFVRELQRRLPTTAEERAAWRAETVLD